MLDWFLSKNLLSDFLLRRYIRFALYKRLQEETKHWQNGQRKTSLLEQWCQEQLALSTDQINTPHQRVPMQFFNYVLGEHLKYSCALWEDSTHDLVSAETAMLIAYCHRADIQDGQHILDLGCGWGATSLYMAEQFPNCQITALTHSNTQAKFIQTQAQQRGLNQINVMTTHLNDFQPQQRFDRIMSIESLEQTRNWQNLFKKMQTWLNADGNIFLHFSCHHRFLYPFEQETNRHWLTQPLYRQGIMPSQDLPHQTANGLEVTSQWNLNGKHYAKTYQAWLKNLHENKPDIIDLFTQKTHNKEAAILQWQYWRLFFTACEELFAYNQGQEWSVSHYKLSHKH